MTHQETPAADWLETIPTAFKPHIEEYKALAAKALHDGHPFYSVRVVKRVTALARPNGGRVLGWAISATTQKGWEYQNTTLDDEGSFWLLFKNPYIFS